MNIFSLRDKLIRNYSDYVRSFFSVRDARIQAEVRDKSDTFRKSPNPTDPTHPRSRRLAAILRGSA